MRRPSPAARLVLPTLIIAGLLPAASLRAAEPEDLAHGWRARVELITQMFQSEQSQVVRDHVVSVAAGTSTLTFDFVDGGALSVSLEGGEVRIDGHPVGRYPAGGALEAAWHALVLDASRGGTPAALALVRSWRPDGLSRSEEALVTLIHERVAPLSAPAGALAPPRDLQQAEPGGLTIDLSDLSDPARLAPLLRSAASLSGPALRITVPGGHAHAGSYSVGSAEQVVGPILVVRGNADIFGRLEGNLATVQGDVVVHPGGVVTGDVLAVSGQVRDLGGDILGQIRTLDAPPPQPAAVPETPRIPAGLRLARNAAGVLGVFLTLLLVGFGMVLFARPPLEVVSDTVLHSFSRSLLVGLLGQVLVLPTFGMLVVGLILSVAGILLVPFAVIVFALLLVLAVLGGFLAIAHAMGESMTRRQLARGVSISSANSYRYVTVGLGGVAALWAAWIVFDWVPIAGTLIFATAVLVTWLLATVGFGAALLSRAGFREHFAGRLLPAESLTDEYLWATPQFGVTAVKRPKK